MRRIRQLAKRDMLEQEDQQDSDLTIIAITGHVEPEYIKKAKDCGINEVYAKPITAKDLGVILLKHGFIQEIPAHLLR